MNIYLKCMDSKVSTLICEKKKKTEASFLENLVLFLGNFNSKEQRPYQHYSPKKHMARMGWVGTSNYNANYKKMKPTTSENRLVNIFFDHMLASLLESYRNFLPKYRQ